MNFLALCNEVLAETDSTSTKMVTVVGQTGILGRVVSWVNQEYVALCRMEPWTFLYERTHEFDTSVGKKEHSATELTITDLDRWDITKATCDDGTNVWNLTPIKFADYQEDYEKTATGRPLGIYITPSGQSVGFYPIPDGVYTVSLPYWKKAVDLAANTDTPLIPSQYRSIIVHRALMRYAKWDDAPGVFVASREDYVKMLAEMYERFLPTITHEYSPVW